MKAFQVLLLLAVFCVDVNARGNRCCQPTLRFCRNPCQQPRPLPAPVAPVIAPPPLPAPVGPPLPPPQQQVIIQRVPYDRPIPVPVRVPIPGPPPPPPLQLPPRIIRIPVPVPRPVRILIPVQLPPGPPPPPLPPPPPRFIRVPVPVPQPVAVPVPIPAPPQPRPPPPPPPPPRIIPIPVPVPQPVPVPFALPPPPPPPPLPPPPPPPPRLIAIPVPVPKRVPVPIRLPAPPPPPPPPPPPRPPPIYVPRPFLVPDPVPLIIHDPPPPAPPPPPPALPPIIVPRPVPIPHPVPVAVGPGAHLYGGQGARLGGPIFGGPEGRGRYMSLNGPLPPGLAAGLSAAGLQAAAQSPSFSGFAADGAGLEPDGLPPAPAPQESASPFSPVSSNVGFQPGQPFLGGADQNTIGRQFQADSLGGELQSQSQNGQFFVGNQFGAENQFAAGNQLASNQLAGSLDSAAPLYHSASQNQYGSSSFPREGFDNNLASQLGSNQFLASEAYPNGDGRSFGLNDWRCTGGQIEASKGNICCNNQQAIALKRTLRSASGDLRKSAEQCRKQAEKDHGGKWDCIISSNDLGYSHWRVNDHYCKVSLNGLHAVSWQVDEVVRVQR